MGNQLASTKPVASPSDYSLHDLPNNVVYKETLGSDRFLKTLQCFHEEGLVVVKVYFKRGDVQDVKAHERKLCAIRDLLSPVEHSHVWPYQRWLETDRAAYLVRQYFGSNLHDRLSTRPFLSLIEKKWVAFQLLVALSQCHERGVCHGDIKCENVLLTSWNWVYLTDFASFKPTFLPPDNPADFSFFFDTGGRRRCYLAPERFCDGGGGGSLLPSMDIFSTGCVIAELFLEGQALFDLSTLLAYRAGTYHPTDRLAHIPDLHIRSLITHMLHLDPSARLAATDYLTAWLPPLFPPYFSPLLHPFFAALLPMDTEARLQHAKERYEEVRRGVGEDGGMGLIATLLCALVRNLRRPHSRRACVELLRQVAASCDDDTRVQRILPFVTALQEGGGVEVPAVVRCAALRALADVAAMVTRFPPTDAALFPEFILPGLSLLPRHPEESVRAAYADTLAQLAATAQRFQVADGEGGGEGLRERVRAVVEELLTGPRSTPLVRKALLCHVTDLCVFLGRHLSISFFLPLLITLLNDRDPHVRAAFFRHLAQVCPLVGPAAVASFFIPCIEQALGDKEEAVAVAALGCLTALCSSGLLHKRLLLGAAERAAPLLCHPSPWLRRSSLTFIMAAGGTLAAADAYAHLLPILGPLLTRTPSSFPSQSALLRCLKPPFEGESVLAVMQPQPPPQPSREVALAVAPAGIPVYSLLLPGPPAALPFPLASRSRPQGSSQLATLQDGLMRVGGVVGISIPEDATWRPKGVLLAHYPEHEAAVTALALPPHCAYFASASLDGSVRIWECKRAERDAGLRSRGVYRGFPPSSAVLSIALLAGDVAAASSDTSHLHSFHVDYVGRPEKGGERFGGLSSERKLGLEEGACVCLKRAGQAVIYCSLRGGVGLWDLRSAGRTWTLNPPPSDGALTKVAVGGGGKWVTSGSWRGVVTLWDTRFHLPLFSWQMPLGRPIEALEAVEEEEGWARPLVYVAGGGGDVGLWNAETGICHHLMRTAGQETARAATWRSGSGGRVGLVEAVCAELKAPPQPPPGVRALLPIAGGATVLTGGSDCIVRLWDRLRPEKSEWVCGPMRNSRLGYDSKMLNGVRTLQELPMPPEPRGGGLGALDLNGCHRDSIRAMAAAQNPQTQKLLITGGRDGSVKVWK